MVLAILLPTSCKKHEENPTVVTDVMINKAEITLLIGDTLRLSATIVPANAKVKNVIWESNDPDIATIDAGGLVTAIAVGETFVTATAEEERSSCRVVVEEPEPEFNNGNIDMTDMTAQEVTAAIEAALRAGITEFKLSGPITHCGIGDSSLGNPFSNNTQITKIDLSKTTDWPVIDLGDPTASNHTTGLPARSFSNCTALTQVILPETIKSIGLSAFYNCAALTTLNLDGITHVGTQAFQNTGLKGELLLPQILYVAPNAFSNCAGITRIEIGQQAFIGESAFAHCEALQQVSATATVEIKKQAFANCPALITVEMPKLQKVGNSAFQGCKALTNVDLPVVKQIESYAFSGNTALKNVTFPQVSEVQDFAFGDCSALETLTLPQATRFGLFIVSGCSALSQLKLSAAGNFYYIDNESEPGNIIDASVFDNTPFKNPQLFSTTGCTLWLNADKKAGAASSTAPQANGNQWVGCTWKEIVFE